MSDFIPALVVLVLLAALVRDDTVLTLCYLLGAVYLAGRWWSRRAFKAVICRRTFLTHAFPNEVLQVQLEIENTSRLPVVWMTAFDSVVPEISAGQTCHEAFSLGPHGRKRVTYDLHTYKRGYYPVGPLFMESGDLFGLGEGVALRSAADYLTVYPRIVPLARFPLPSRSPFGALKTPTPIFEDPARIIGKRDFVAGDSMRRVDWKASAATGRLQTKLLEPSLALEASIALDLHQDSFEEHNRYDAVEMAVCLAASAASYLISRKLTAGLATNADVGDRGPERVETTVVEVRKGRSHLMRILEVLARAQPASEGLRLEEIVRAQAAHLAWGTTLIVITGRSAQPDRLIETLLHAQRAGLQTVVFFVSQFSDFPEFRQRAAGFNLPVYQVTQPRDLDRWR